MFAESGVLQAAGRFVRATDQPGGGEKRDQPSLADDQIDGWEPLRGRSRGESPAETAERQQQQQQQQQQQGQGQHLQKQQQPEKAEHAEGWVQSTSLPQNVVRTAPAGRHGTGLASRLCPRGEEARRRVDGGASSSDRWAALQVSIPRLEVKGPAVKLLADSSGSSNSKSGGSFTAATVAAAMSGVPSRGHGWQGTAVSPPSTGFGEGGEGTRLVGIKSDGEIDGIARGNGSSTAVSAAKVAAPSLLLTESRPFSLTTVRSDQEGVLDQPQPPTPPSKNTSPVEVHVNEEGKSVYRFSTSAPSRRGKWSRMEEEYAKRIIREFDEGVLDAPAGVGLRQLLSSKLHCEVMRVSKKFCGWQCVGKRCYRPVFHHDGRTTRARAALFEMEQNWLKTFPSPSRSKPARKLTMGGDDGGGGSTTCADGNLERPAPLLPSIGSLKRGAMPAQTWFSRVERSSGGNSAGVGESLAKEGRLYGGSGGSGSLGHWSEEPRDAPSGGEQQQEVESKTHDDRGLVSPSADGSDHQQQQQVRAVSRSEGYDHHRHHFVGTKSGSSAGPNGCDGEKRQSWAPSSSHGSQQYMQGGAPPGKPVANPREQQCEEQRSPSAGLSLWQRPKGRLPNGTTGRDLNANLYPMFSKRRKGGEDAAAVYRGVKESTVTSGDLWAKGQAARTHQPQRQSPCTKNWRDGGHAREDTQKRHRGGVRPTVSGAPAEKVSLGLLEHDAARHEVSAGDETCLDSYPRYESEGRRSTSGRFGGRAAKIFSRWRQTEAAVGRRPFRLRPELALPLHLRMDNNRDAFLPGNDQASTTTASEPGQYAPPASDSVAPPLEPSSKRYHTSRQFSEGQDPVHCAANDERSARRNDSTAGLEEYRPAKATRVIGSFSHAGTGGGSGDREGDDRPLYATYREHQHHMQQQQQRRHPGTATARCWQSGRTGNRSDACAAAEAYRPSSRSTPMGRGATRSPRPPSRDCFSRVSASPISVVDPSSEHGPVEVGPGGVVQKFCAF